MKYFKFLILLIAVKAIVLADVDTLTCVDTTKSAYYMYVYFLNSEEKAGARLAFSTDGINWLKYNDGNAVITPLIGDEGLARDPNIYYDSVNSIFRMVWTCDWLGNEIGYATTKDLVHWSTPQAIHIGSSIPDIEDCWAPEIFYDDIQNKYMIYWSVFVSGVGQRTYYTLTSDFSTFTDPVKFFDPGYTVIDATLFKVADGKYYMFFKDERETSANLKAKNIHYVVGKTPQGGVPDGYTADSVATNWSAVSSAITKIGMEGPTAIKIGDEYRVYFDPFNEYTSTYRMVKSTDLKTWSQGEVLNTIGGNFLYNHGSISMIPRKYVMHLLYNQALDTGMTTDTTVTYPLGKRNVGCGTGVGLAFIPPIGYKIAASRRRRKKILSVKK
ncbi:MAG TPA: hypothetical protein DCO75_02940 [Fibrobacteres bacterium]|nr:hypothetical protein [Fibrobacterota bacterium]